MRRAEFGWPYPACHEACTDSLASEWKPAAFSLHRLRNKGWFATFPALAGYCGLDQVKLDLDAPADALSGADQSQLLDISLYCTNSVPNGVLVLLGLGCILRLLTTLALAYVPRGIRLQPVLQGVAHMFGWGRRQRRRAQHQAAAAAGPAEQEPVRRSATP